MLTGKLLGAGGAGVPDSGWLYSSTGTGTTSTFSSVPLGVAHSSRYIVVGVGHETAGGTSTTAVTVGGISATKLASSNPGAWFELSMWGASVPSGTTGAVVVTKNGSVNSVVSVMGLFVGSSTPTATVGNQNTDPSNVSVNTVGPKGIVATFAFHRPATVSLVSLTGATEVDDVTYTNWTLRSALATGLSTESPRTVTWDWSGQYNNQRAVAASFEGA